MEHSPNVSASGLPLLIASLIEQGLVPERVIYLPNGRIDFVLPQGIGVSLRLPPEDEAPPPAEPAAAEAPAETSTLEMVILGVLRLADKPLKGEAVASRCERSYSGPFRKVMAHLRKDGHIQLGEAGYILTPISPEATP